MCVCMLEMYIFILNGVLEAGEHWAYVNTNAVYSHHIADLEISKSC